MDNCVHLLWRRCTGVDARIDAIDYVSMEEVEGQTWVFTSLEEWRAAPAVCPQFSSAA